MADWTTISSFATAGGTLVLAAATYSSVRSANRAARTAERALETRLRPVLMPSRLQDPPEKVMWADRHWAKVGGGRAVVEREGDVVYLAMALRNVGSGIAVLHGWHLYGGRRSVDDGYAPPDDFRRQTVDLIVPPGDTGFWQGAIRDADDSFRGEMAHTLDSDEGLTVELLYSDHEGGQRAISRFFLTAAGETGWLAIVSRHWNLDRQDPR